MADVQLYEIDAKVGGERVWATMYKHVHGFARMQELANLLAMEYTEVSVFDVTNNLVKIEREEWEYARQ